MAISNITDSISRNARASQLSEYVNLSTVGGGPTDASFTLSPSSYDYNNEKDTVTTSKNIKSYSFLWGFNKMGSSTPVGE